MANRVTFRPYRREDPSEVQPEETFAPVEQRAAHALEFIAERLADISYSLQIISENSKK
jgi:hypothetical protein